jgi:hypothetical protein
MKKYRLIALLLLATMAGGCDKFLEEYSLNELRPGTVIDLQQLMMGEAYPVSDFFAPYLEYLTDNVTSSFPTAKRADDIKHLSKFEGAYLWRHDMFETMQEQGVTNANSYELYYRRIMACNVVLDHLDGVTGSADEKNKARGEALALRAYYYFMLVNLYGQPYNAPGVDVETTPGVPLILSSIVKDDYPTRASVGAVYRQVETDLLEAETLLVELGKSNSKWRVTDLFVYTLLSRVYLYEERWEESVTYATKVWQRNPLLVDLHKQTITGGTNLNPVTGTITYTFTSNVFNISDVEAIWLFSNSRENGFPDIQALGALYNFTTSPASYSVSPELLGCYTYTESSSATVNRKDLRPHFFYRGYGNFTATARYRVYGMKTTAPFSGDATLPTKGMRVAEVYLNRAEANIRLFIASGNDAKRVAAVADLDYLRRHRHDLRANANPAFDPAIPADIAADGEKLLEFCLNERRRELSFEEHRWFDLRRNGMPEIVHTFRLDAEQEVQEYKLLAGDDRYVLPIPAVALEKNPALVPNPSNTPR